MSLTRRFRRRFQRKQSIAKKRHKVYLEPLEPRILLSSDPLSYTAAAGAAVDLTLRLQDINGEDTIQLVDTSNLSVLQSQNLKGTSEVEIIGSDQDDTLRIDLDFDLLPDSLRINFAGGDGEDTLVGPAADSTWHITGRDAGNVGRVDFFEVENLVGSADNEDTFVLEEDCSLSESIEGGSGGFDSLVVEGGSYSNVVLTATGPDSGIVSYDGTLIVYSGLEPIDFSSTSAGTVTIEITNDADNVLELSRGNDTTIKLDDAPGVLIDTIEEHLLSLPSLSNLIIDLGAGEDSLNITGSMDFGSANLSVTSETISVDSSADITTNGNITLTSDASLNLDEVDLIDALNEFVGNVANTSVHLPELIADFFIDDARAEISLAGANISAGNITLTATATIFGEVTGILASDPGLLAVLPGFSAAFANVGSTASVLIDGGNVATTGNLTISALSDVSVTTTAEADASNTDTSLEAAIALSIVTSNATAHITGDPATTGAATLSVGGILDMQAINVVDVTTKADGSPENNTNLAGGTVAVAVVTVTTQAAIDGDVNIGASSPTAINLGARSTTDIDTDAIATAGGAESNTEGTQTTMADKGASTSEGTINLAGALAINEVTSETSAFVDSTQSIETSGLFTLDSFSDTDSDVNADASKVGSSGTAGGVGVAAAVNIGDTSNRALVDGRVIAGGLTADAKMNKDSSGDGETDDDPDGTNTFNTAAVSGAGAANVGLAGSLAVNVLNHTSTAVIKGKRRDRDGNLVKGAAEVTLSGKAFDPAASDVVDLGEDTITIADHGFGNGDVVVYQVAEGGTTIDGLEDGATYYVVGVKGDTFSLSATEGGDAINLTDTGTGTSHKLTNKAGDVTLISENNSNSTAKATPATEAGAEGSAFGMGASVAVNVGVHTIRSEIEDGVVLTGADDVTLKADANHVMTTTAEMGAAGGIALTPVAGVSVAVNDTQALLGSGAELELSGDLKATATHEGTTTTTADGSTAGKAGAVGLSLAVTTSVDDVSATTKRSIDAGGDVSFEAVSLVAGSASAVASAKGGKGLDGKEFNPTDKVEGKETKVVNKDTEVITITDHGFTDGQKVKYNNNGGTDVGGLTNGSEYYVMLVGENELKLSKTKESPTAIDLKIEDGTDYGEGHVLAVADPPEGKSVDGQVDSLLTLGEDAGKNNGMSEDDKPERSEDAKSESADGAVTVAGAAGVNVGVSSATANIEDGLTITSKGGLTLNSSNQTDYAASADGSATSKGGTGSTEVGIGAAVAVNVGVSEGEAIIGNNVKVEAKSVTLHSGMTQKKLSLKTSDVSKDDNTITFSSAHGLTTGQAVTYDHGEAGSDIDGLEHGKVYYVVVVNEKTIKLAKSRDNALLEEPEVVELDVASADGEDHHLIDKTNVYSAKAVSGASGGTVGIAGSLGVNVSVNKREAVARGKTIEVTGGDIDISSENNSMNLATAIPTEKGVSGDKVGVGASAAINVAAEKTVSEIADGTVVSGKGLEDVRLSAVSEHDMVTYAKAGAKGGVGVTPVAAVSVSANETKARIGTESSDTDMNLSGDLDVKSNNKSTMSTTSEGKAEGDVAVGISLAVGVAVDNVSASVERGFSVNEPTEPGDKYDATIQAKSESSTETIAIAGAKGASEDKDSNGGDTDEQTNKWANHKKPEGQTDEIEPPAAEVDDPEGKSEKKKVSVAAAVGVGISSNDTKAFIGDGNTITANDIKIEAVNHSNYRTKANGDAVGSLTDNTTDIGIGAAVGITVADNDTDAYIGKGNTIVSRGDVEVKARSEQNLEAKFLRKLTSEAIAGASGGEVAVAGALSLIVSNNDTQAYIDSTIGEQTTVTANSGSVNIISEDKSKLSSRAWAGAISKGDESKAGVGAAFSIIVAENKNKAYTGEGTKIYADEVLIKADSQKVDPADFIDAMLDGAEFDKDFFSDFDFENMKDTPNILNANNYYTEAGAGSVSTKGTGIAGAFSINIFKNETSAFIGNQSVVDTTGLIDVQALRDTTALALGGALSGGKKVGAGVTAVNITNLDRTRAYIGKQATVDSDDSVNVNAESEQLLFTVGISGAAAGGGGEGIALNGVLGVAISNSIVEAYIDESANVSARDSVFINAENSTTSVMIAGGGSAGQKAAVGGSVGTNIFYNKTRAFIAENAEVDAYNTIDVKADAKQTAVNAVISGAAGGKVGVTGAISVNTILTETSAKILEEAQINQDTAFFQNGLDKGKEVIVSAHDDTVTVDVVGAGAGGGSAGVGAAIDTVVVSKTVEASINGNVKADQNIKVEAESDVKVITVTAGFAGGGKVGVGGAVSVVVVNNDTTAIIGSSAVVDSDGNVRVSSADDLVNVSIAGSGAGGGNAGVGGSLAVTAVTSHTKAYVADGAIVNARGLDSSLVGDIKGLLVEADTSEDVISIVAAGAGGGTAGVAATVSNSVIATKTEAFIGKGAKINQTGNDLAGAEQSVAVMAFSDTVAVGIGISGAGGGSAGVGVALNVPVIAKTTKAYIDDGVSDNYTVIDAKQDVMIEAVSEENLVSIVVAAAGGGSAGVGGTVSANVAANTTRAYLGKNVQADAGGNIGITASSKTNFGPSETEDGELNNIFDDILYQSKIDIIDEHLTNPTKEFRTQSDGDKPVQIDYDANTITFDEAHNYENGQAVVYGNDGGPDIGNLEKGKTYYVVLVGQGDEPDPKTIKLAATKNNATSDTPLTIDLTDAGSTGNHSLTLTEAETEELRHRKKELVADRDGDDSTSKELSLGGIAAVSLAFGGAAGIGGALAVGVISNRTEAYIDDGAVTNARGTTLIHAESEEAVGSITVAGAGGGSAGVAGAVAVSVINTETSAYTGENVMINQDPAFYSGAQNVDISASDDVIIIGLGGSGAGGGAAGVGAAANANVILNKTNAFIGNGSQVYAHNDISVSATTNKDIYTALIAGAGGGAAGVAGTVSINAIGSLLDREAASGLGDVNSGSIGDTGNSADSQAGDTSELDMAEDSATYIISDETILELDNEEIADKLADLKYKKYDSESDFEDALKSVLTEAEYDEHRDTLFENSRSAGSEDAKQEVVDNIGKTSVSGYLVEESDTIDINTFGTQVYVGFNAEVIAGNGINIDAVDATQIVQLNGSGSGAGAAGVAGSLAVNLIHDSAEAFIADGAVVKAENVVGVQADTEDYVYSVAIAASGAGAASVNGCGIFNIVTSDTHAYVGQATVGTLGASDFTEDTKNVEIAANSDSTILNVAASGGGAGAAAVGGVLGTNVLNKDTSAYIYTGAVVSADENIKVIAESGENLIGGGLSLRGAGAAAVGGVAEINVLTNITEAYISRGATVKSDGNVVLSAVDDALVITMAAAGGGAGAAAVQGTLGVSTIANSTQAYISDTKNSDEQTSDQQTIVDALGLGAGVNVYTGEIDENNLSAMPELKGEAEDKGSIDINGEKKAGKEGGTVVTIDENGLGSNVESNLGVDSSLTQSSHGLGEKKKDEIHGLSVTAISNEKIISTTLAIAVAGAAGVAGNAQVNVIASSAKAFIGDEVVVNGNTPGAGAQQSVTVLASDTAAIFGIAGSVGAAIVAGVSGSVNTGIISNDSTAYIGQSQVTANQDVSVQAFSDSSIDLYTANLSVGGAAGVGGAASVGTISNTTSAALHDGANVKAGRNLGVHAGTKSEISAKTASGAGGGLVGASGAVSVGVIANETTASFGQNVETNAGGLISVTAASDEKLDNWTASGSGGTVGLAGVVNTQVIEGTTSAIIGSGIRINQDSNYTNVYQHVLVNATSVSEIKGRGGSAAVGGAAGLGGSIDVSVINNTTSARIEDSLSQFPTIISAGGDIEVRSSATKNVTSYSVAGTAGAVGVSGALSVVSIGSSLSDDARGESGNTSTDINKWRNEGTDTQSLTAGFRSVERQDGQGNSEAEAIGPNNDYASGSKDLIDDKADENSLDDTLTDDLSESKGKTQAYVGDNVLISAGNDISVLAEDSTTVVIKAGGVAVGGVAGIGGAVGITTIRNNTEAVVNGSTLSAGNTINISSLDTVNANTDAFGGGDGAVGLGAAVAYIDVDNATKSVIMDNATILTTGTLSIKASRIHALESDAVGTALGGGAIGASLSRTYSGGLVEAAVGNNVSIGGDSNPTNIVGNLEIDATSSIAANANATSGAAGVVAGQGADANANVTPSIRSYIGENSDVEVDGNVEIKATSQAAEGDAKADAYGGGGLKIGASIAGVTVSPKIDSHIGSGTSVNASGNVIVRAEAEAGNEGPLNDYFNPKEDVDTDNETITFEKHSLRDGDTITYDPNGNDAISTPGGDLGTKDEIQYREYGVLVIDEDTIKLGADFNGSQVNTDSGVDPIRDVITFKTQHHLETGDAVIYYNGGNANINGDLTGTLYVRKIDDFIIKLFKSRDNAIAKWEDLEPLTPSAIDPATGTIRIEGHTFTDGQAVTYHAPPLSEFGSLYVDVKLENDEVDKNNLNKPENNVDNDKIYIKGHGFVNGDKVIYRADGDGALIGYLVEGKTYVITNTTLNTFQLKEDGSTNPIELIPKKDTDIDRNVVHTLQKISDQPIGALEDSVTYYVINANQAKGTFQLSETNPDVGSALAIALDTTNLDPNAEHRIRTGGIDLNAAEGTHELYIDIDSAPDGDNHKLLGAGGVSLRQMAAAAGDGKSSAVARGGGISGADFAFPKTTLNAEPTVKAYVAAQLLETGGDVRIESKSAGDVSGFVSNLSGGFVKVDSVSADVIYKNTNVAFVGKDFIGATKNFDAAGVVIKAGGNFSLNSDSAIDAKLDAMADGGGAFAYSKSDAKLDINSVTHSVIGKNALISGDTVEIDAQVSSIDAKTYARAISIAFAGIADASATNNTDSDAKVLIEGNDSTGTMVTGREGVDIQASQIDIVNKETVFTMGSALWIPIPVYIERTETTTTDTIVDAASDVQVKAGAARNKDALIVKADDEIKWNADVIVSGGAVAELIVDANGNIVEQTNIDATISNGDVIVNNIINDNNRNVTFESAKITGSDGIWDFRDSIDKVTIINNSDKDLKINSIDVINRSEPPEIDLRAAEVSFTFFITHSISPSHIEIENLGDSDIILNGLIENPIGETEISNSKGDIFSAGPPAIVRTNILDMEAPLGSIGTSEKRINVELVQSAGRGEHLIGNAGEDIYLNLKGRLREDVSDFTVNVDSIRAGGNADVLLQSSVLETEVDSAGKVLVTTPEDDPNPYDSTDDLYANHFRPDDGSAPWLDLGAFANINGSDQIVSTYNFGHLEAGSSLLDGNIIVKAADPTSAMDINIVGNTNILGTGHVDADTNGSITLTETEGDIRVGAIRSATADVILAAAGSIVDALDDADSDVIGVNINLAATGGGIGSEANYLEIDSSNPDDGLLSAVALDDIYLAETNDDLTLARIHSAGGRAYIEAPGDIIDGNPTTLPDIEADSVSLTAGGGAGSEGDPLDTRVNHLEAETVGGLWILNSGGLTLGGADDGKAGIVAGGPVQITASSPVTVAEDVTAADNILITATDSATAGDDLTLLPGVTVASTAGDVALRAGDDLVIADGATIQAAGDVTLSADFGNADSGIGSTIDLGGTITGSSVLILGEDDGDTVRFNTDLTDPTTVYTFDGSDVLVFGDAVGINGHIDGGAGADTLDYLAWTTDVTVNLSMGSATGIAGGAEGRVLNFENVIGGSGQDWIMGDDRDNHLVGTDGDDIIFGLGGDDILDGGCGSDYMDGGVGDDTYIELPGGYDRIVDAAGVDLIDFSDAEYGIKIDLRLDHGQKQKVDAARNRLSIQGVIENVIGSSFGDIIRGNDVPNIIRGGAGDDYIDGNRGDDELFGEAGDDRLHGGRGNDALYGGEGDDDIYGGRGNDALDGGEGNDEIYGDRGEDALYGGEGDDKIYGGRGIDQIEGGLGNDHIEGGRGNDTLYGGDGNDEIYGGRGEDALYGGEGDDKIYGGRGKDALYGGEGDDEIYGGRGNDALDGGEGNDEIYGGRGIDALDGGEGNDEIYGGRGNDTLYGGEGDDALFGDGGDDLLSDGVGNDAIALWVKSFVTDLAGASGKGNPNEKIKITLPEKEVETQNRP